MAKNIKTYINPELKFPTERNVTVTAINIPIIPNKFPCLEVSGDDNPLKSKINTTPDTKYKIEDKFHISGVKILFESGQDLYEFIVRQPEFEWEIHPHISTINSLTGEYKTFDLVYQPTGFNVV